MKKRVIVILLMLCFAGGVAAYFVSLDAPQDFPINI